MEYKPSGVGETIALPEGLMVDMEEGFRKLSNRQFGGDPGRAFCEMLQNFLDSYPGSTPWEERKGEIATSHKTISITDYGEGLSLEKIRLLLTLGGTDKKDDLEKIGRFGIGFFYIFNTRLWTREVLITTRCEDETVLLKFVVSNPGKRPEISARILDKPITFSTRIKIHFDRQSSVERCLQHVRKSLKYYPCRVHVNGKLLTSVWDTAKTNAGDYFREGACRGFLLKAGYDNRVTVLSKYERITDTHFRNFITGGRRKTFDLNDFSLKGVPYVPGVGVIINSMTLKVTIGRDGFFLGAPYTEMVQALADSLLLELGNRMRDNPDSQIILANQFILRQKIRHFFTKNRAGVSSAGKTAGDRVLQVLSEAKVYRLKGRKSLYSLSALKAMHSPELPLYYCRDLTNVDWLGGAFKHDFVVLAKTPDLGGGAPGFFDALFGAFFKEPLNLDKIAGDRKKIKHLVSRGIIDPSALKPDIRIKGDLELSEKERRLLHEIDDLLAHEGTRSAIARHLHLDAVSIRSALFEINEWGATVSTGIFNQNGEILTEGLLSNFKEAGKEVETVPVPGIHVELLVGINAANPLVDVLSQTNDPHRAYYALSLLARELAKCQHLLTPHSSFYHMVKNRLANELLKAMLERLLNEGGSANAKNARQFGKRMGVKAKFACCPET